MSGVTTVAVGAVFLALLIAIAAVMMWQEAKSRASATAPSYVVEDAISTIVEHLDSERLARLGRGGVRRIVEWEVFYLQGLADKKAARRGITVVAGGDDLAVSYIRDQLERRGHVYDEDDIKAVLQGEAAYLSSIGVIGAQVDPEAAVDGGFGPFGAQASRPTERDAPGGEPGGSSSSGDGSIRSGSVEAAPTNQAATNEAATNQAATKKAL